MIIKIAKQSINREEINMQKFSVLIILIIWLIPSVLFADSKLETGYDLYHNLKIMDDPKSIDEINAVAITLGYLNGYLDGYAVGENGMFNQMFPKKYLTAKEIKENSKKLDIHRIDMPEKGIAIGQFILIYKKWAKNHPENLNDSARICIHGSLVEAFGWK